jgi:hypothetical protein
MIFTSRFSNMFDIERTGKTCRTAHHANISPAHWVYRKKKEKPKKKDKQTSKAVQVPDSQQRPLLHAL